MSADTPAADKARRRCCFSDAVGSRVAGCTKAVRSTKRYRRTVECTSSRAHGVCAAWLDCVRRASTFTLGARQSPSALPRRTAVKLQGGGLLGMGDVIEEHQRSGRIQDVSDLLRRALARYGSFDSVPLQRVIQRVHEFDADER